MVHQVETTEDDEAIFQLIVCKILIGKDVTLSEGNVFLTITSTGY